MTHIIKEIKEKNQTRVTVTQRGGGRGGGSHQSFIWRGSTPGTNPLPFVCTVLYRKGTPFVYPLVTNGTPFTYQILITASSFNCCKYTIFTSHIHKMHLTDLIWSFNWLKWQMSLLYTSSIKKTLPFHVPEAWKRYPIWGEPLGLGHYSTPSCTEHSTWYSDIVWYELHQTFRPHEEVLWLFYDNFHFSSKNGISFFGISFLGGGANWPETNCFTK